MLLITKISNDDAAQVSSSTASTASSKYKYDTYEAALDTAIYTSVITRYFDAETYLEQGYQTPISIESDITFPTQDNTVVIEKSISKTEVSFYDNAYFDTSSFTFTDLAKKFTNYKVENQNRRSMPRSATDAYAGHFRVDFTQSRIINIQEWSVDSLDIIFGLVGGIAGIIWPFLAYIMYDYEQFS